MIDTATLLRRMAQEKKLTWESMPSNERHQKAVLRLSEGPMEVPNDPAKLQQLVELADQISPVEGTELRELITSVNALQHQNEVVWMQDNPLNQTAEAVIHLAT